MSEGNSEIAFALAIARAARTAVFVETGVGRRSFRAILNDLFPTDEYARVITETGKRDSATRQAVNSSRIRINQRTAQQGREDKVGARDHDNKRS